MPLGRSEQRDRITDFSEARMQAGLWNLCGNSCGITVTQVQSWRLGDGSAGKNTHLLHKHEALSSDSQNPCEKSDAVMYTSNPGSYRVGIKGLL